MLHRHLYSRRTLEWVRAAEPLVDDYSQGVLITGWTGLSPELLGCHVCRGTRRIEWALLVRTLSQDGDAKVTEQDLIASSQQHVLWFDISMDQSLVMSTL